MAHSDWYDLFDTYFNVYRIPIDRTQAPISGASEPTIFEYKSNILCSLQPYSKGVQDRIDVMYDRINFKHMYEMYCDVEDYPDPIETDLVQIIVNRKSRVFKIISISNEINKEEVQKINLELQPENTFKL